MKKLFLLLIPLLFVGCNLSVQDERCDFVIINGASDDLMIILSDEIDSYGPAVLYSKLECGNHRKDCDYTLKVKYKNRPDDGWTTFIFHPVYKTMNYYIIDSGVSFLMFSDPVNGKSEDIKRFLPE